jgi:SAM-dependent methyltransferase
MYQGLAGDYHLLFPARPAQLEFLCSLAGEPPGRVLDVASGTGEYAAALAASGYDCTGVELGGEMHERALLRHACGQLPGGGSLTLIKGDMRDLPELVAGPFRLVYCIGNSLPHLSNDTELAQVVAAMLELAGDGGTVALQMVNFDRILKAMAAMALEASAGAEGDSFHNVELLLPPLAATRDDGTAIEFRRSYRFNQPDNEGETAGLGTDSLRFVTRLLTPEGEFTGESRLLALTRLRLETLLPEGAHAEWYGDFDGQPWGTDSPAAVVILHG